MTDKKPVQSVSSRNDVFIIVLAGSLDVSVQKELREELLRTSTPESDVILDCANVSFIDSSCLGVLVSLAKSYREKSGGMKLVNLNDDVRSIFQITRLDRIFEIFDSVDEAVDSFYR